MNNLPETKEIGFRHLRTKSGMELIGNLHSVKINGREEYSVLYFPLRIMYNVSSEGSVLRFLPLSLFSEDEFFVVYYDQLEFMIEMNEVGIQRYQEYMASYNEAKRESMNEDVPSVEPTTKIIH